MIAALIIAVVMPGLWLLAWWLCRISAPRRHKERQRRLMALFADPKPNSLELWRVHRHLL